MDSQVKYYVQKYLGAKFNHSDKEWVVNRHPRITAHEGTVWGKRPVVLSVYENYVDGKLRWQRQAYSLCFSFEQIKTLGAIKAFGIETMLEAAKGMYERDQNEKNLKHFGEARFISMTPSKLA